MDIMQPAPTTFRGIVEADLRRAARAIIKVQDELDFQFRIATPQGDYAIAVTMPNDPHERSAMLRRVGTFMAWRQALAFSLAVELVEPDAVYCVGISARARHHCQSRITRTPKPWTKANFGPVEWLPESAIDPALAELLPVQPRPLTPKEVAAADKWFGTKGKFPAIHIATGEVRGL